MHLRPDGPACAVLDPPRAAHQDAIPADPESESVYKSATTRRRKGNQNRRRRASPRHGRPEEGRPAEPTGPRRGIMTEGSISPVAGFPGASRGATCQSNIYRKQKYAIRQPLPRGVKPVYIRNTEDFIPKPEPACIDPDSRDTTAFVALCTPEPIYVHAY